MRTVVMASLVTLVALAAAAQSQPSNTPPPAPVPVAQPPAAPANQPAPPETPGRADERTNSPNPTAMNDRRKTDPVEASVARLDARLKLSEDQKTTIKAIIKDERDQILALRENKTLTSQQIVEKQRALHATTDEMIRGVLTPEQLEKYQRSKQMPMAKQPSAAARSGAPAAQAAPQDAQQTAPPPDSK